MASTGGKKRGSKKKKVDWRKHCDTKDVDNFLEDKRLEERLGFSFSDKPDDELFQIDKTANDKNQEHQLDFSKNVWTRGDSDQAVEGKGKNLIPVKCFEILLPQSAVSDPIRKRNRVRTLEERKHPLVKRIETERKKHGILKAKEIGIIRNRVLAEERRRNKHKRDEFKEDLWNGDTGNDVLDGNAEWLTPTTLQHTLKNTGQMKKRIPVMLKKKFPIPAIESPHPGMSYNPTFSDHQELLREVADKEMKIIKEEEHLNRVTTKMFSKVTKDTKENLWLSEMSEGLPKIEEPTSEEEKEETSEYTSVNSPVKNKKKTIQQRKKQKAAQKDQLQRKLTLVEKKKIADIYKLKFLEKQFKSREQKLARLREKRERVKALKANEPKRLSKTKYETPELEFNLPKELRGSLRCVKMEGNLLSDRFKSLQRRSVVEPSVKHIPKKAKKKVFQKASHRMPWEVFST